MDMYPKAHVVGHPGNDHCNSHLGIPSHLCPHSQTSAIMDCLSIILISITPPPPTHLGTPTARPAVLPQASEPVSMTGSHLGPLSAAGHHSSRLTLSQCLHRCCHQHLAGWTLRCGAACAQVVKISDGSSSTAAHEARHTRRLQVL
jgi:hypothetical protein